LEIKGMVSMNDIAVEAQVSRTTVSLVLNDRYIKGVNISDETRQRVKEIAHSRGYRQNVLASSMAKGKSRLIGCLGLNPGQEVALYLGQVMTAAVQAATEHDYSLKLLSPEHSVDQLVEECFGYRMSGVIVRSRNRAMFDQLHQQLSCYHIPTVLIDTDYEEAGVTSINSDDADGMRQIVAHLVQLGHQKLAFIAFENDVTPFARVRRNGYLTAVREFGLPLDETSCYATDTVSTRHPYDRAEELALNLLTGHNRPTAIVCYCDEVAMLVLRAAWKAGISVPQQLSVVGFGNLAMDVFACPPLTSLDRPYSQIGVAAVTALIDHSEETKSISLPVQLVVRQSTGPAPR